MSSLVAAMSVTAIGRTWPVFRQGRELPALLVEVSRRQPGFKSGADGGPFAVDDREPGGIAVAALHHHVPSEDAFINEPKPLSGAARRLVQRVAFPLEAAISQVVERMSRQQEDRLRRLAGALQYG